MANSITPFIPMDTSNGMSIEIATQKTSVAFPGITDVPGGDIFKVPIDVPNNTLFAMARIPYQIQYTITATNWSTSNVRAGIQIKRERVSAALSFISYLNSNGALTLYQNTPTPAVFSPTTWALMDELHTSGIGISSTDTIYCTFSQASTIPANITRYDTSNCVIELLFATAIVK